MIRPLPSIAIMALLPSFLLGQTRPNGPPTTSPMHERLEALPFVEQEMAIGERILRYRATAATMLMRDEAGKPKASFFFVAYELDRGRDADPAARPITFIFNGGPGAAAVWLHLGAAGPKKLFLADDGEASAPPYKLVDNPATWLDATDLVFIDPVNTGFSRPAPGEAKEQFHGVEEDIRWVGEFIRLYITRHERWLSPKFLAGESYGTTRAAGLAEHLLGRQGIALNGVIEISSALDFQTIQLGEGNDLPYILFLPSYTAVAWYHKKLPEDLQGELAKAIKEAERYAMNEYTLALAKGGSLGEEERNAIAARLARFTSLPVDFILKANLRIGPEQFQKRLLGEQRKRIGRFDGRIVGIDPNPAVSWPSYDPSLARYLPIYAATFNDYVRRTLKYESDLHYEVLSDKVQPWNYGPSGRGYLNLSDELRAAMVKNPHMKVFFGSGYFDLATPYLSSDYTINHLDLGRDLRGNITRAYYMGGHMMYHDQQSLVKLKNDVAAFIRDALPRPASRPAGRP